VSFDLENEFQTKLHLAGRLGRAEDAAEVRTEGDATGNIEVGMIEDVEYFPTKFDSPLIPDGKISLKAHVDVGQSRRKRHVAAGTAERKWSGLRKCGGVEPSLRVTFLPGKIGIAQQVGPLRRARADVRAIDSVDNRERRAALERRDSA